MSCNERFKTWIVEWSGDDFVFRPHWGGFVEGNLYRTLDGRQTQKQGMFYYSYYFHWYSFSDGRWKEVNASDMRSSDSILEFLSENIGYGLSFDDLFTMLKLYSTD